MGASPLVYIDPFPQSELKFFFLHARKHLAESPLVLSLHRLADIYLASRPYFSAEACYTDSHLYPCPLSTTTVAMEQDQEDFFDTWNPSMLDHHASDNIAENVDFFSNDGHSGLLNLVDGLVPESANPNIESADLLPSLDEVNDFEFLFKPSELPTPTQTTSSIQVPQSGNFTGDEPFRFANLGADASCTGQHPPESLARIATADSVSVAQSTDFTGNDMSAFNDMELDAPYAKIDFSLSSAPTINTGLVQAAQLANLIEDGTSRTMELDPDLVMAPSRPTAISFEQLPPPVSTDRIFPTEIAQSANSMTSFNRSGSRNSSSLTSHTHPSVSSSNEMTTTMSTPGKQLQSQSGNSIPSRVYAPLQPKPAAISQSTEMSSTSESQESSLLPFSSQGTLASRPASSVSKGKIKRLRSPQARPSKIPKNVPENCFLVFQMTEQSKVAKDKDQQQPVTKRTRSARACLRCQILKEKVSCRYALRRADWADKSTVLGPFSL